MNQFPPRLLAGFSLIIWGGLTGHTTWGLIAAILLESRFWISIRWDFTRTSYIKAWQFSVLAGVLIAMMAWINGIQAGKLHTLFEWAPLALLPLELAQRYGKASHIPLNTFSFFARKKMDRDLQQGRKISPRMINTGYPYIAVVILATAMASKNDLHHFIGLSLIAGCCLFSYVKNNGFRPLAWTSAFILVLACTFVGHIAIFKLYDLYSGIGDESGGRRTSTNESRTSIGKLGRLKLSPKIFWRMKTHEGNVPKLLRTATYNRYSRARWTHEFNPPPDDSQRDEQDYIEDTNFSKNPDRDIRCFLDTVPPGIEQQGNISIIGELNTSIKENPIPLPHHTLAIGDLGEEPDIFANSLGTVKISNPETHIIEYTVWIGDESTTEVEPIEEFDLAIPETEKDAVARIARQLQLTDPSIGTREKIRRLRHFFSTKFQYSTHLNTPGIKRGKRHSAISGFLERTRSGHCEYFATATALLLRHAGIPTRYCVGFSVHEHSDDYSEWVMRGEHAHAWCRVWVQERTEAGQLVAGWEDVDLTPAAWHLADIRENTGWQRRFTDWWQRVRENFLIWRTRETNKTKVVIIIAALASLLILWIGWRLWKSKQWHRKSKQNSYIRTETAVTTPLHKLEKLARKKLGHRPPGIPLCQWFIQLKKLDPSIAPQLHQITELHSRLRFDPNGGSSSDSEKLAFLAKTIRKHLKS